MESGGSSAHPCARRLMAGNDEQRARARRLMQLSTFPEEVTVIVEPYGDVQQAANGIVFVSAHVVMQPAKGDGR